MLLTASTASSVLYGADSDGFGSGNARFGRNDYSDLDASNLDDPTLSALNLEPSKIDLSNLDESDLAQDLDLKKNSDSTLADLSNFFLQNPLGSANRQ